MKSERTVIEFGSEYKCISFTDVDPDVSGVEVYNNNKRLGSIIDISIPDENDEEEIQSFENEVIDWIIENE